MKLRYTPTSPYVRKVTVIAHETGLHDKIERIPSNPWAPDTDLPKDNPIGKVPALVTDGGETLFDSPLICEYLDSLHGGRKLFPPSGGDRWTALRRHSLGDGLLDATVARIIEGRRPDTPKSEWWLERQKNAIRRTLDACEEDADGLAKDPISIGHIAIAVALSFMDFRFAAEDWRPGHPKLAKWHAEFCKRPSMMQTVPKDPT